MSLLEKQVVYTTTNTYSTLNKLSSETKNVWFVCHGIGYLSKYFLRYFKELPKNENYIIAPQAPSKYYLTNTYTHVGASWLTRENTANEIENVISYLNTVYKAENIPENCNIIIFGYSQGVSIVTRWLAQQKIKCDHIILYAGSLPNELEAKDFLYLKKHNTKTTVITGNKDEYFDEKRIDSEMIKIKKVIDKNANLITFDGGHEVKKEIINTIVK